MKALELWGGAECTVNRVADTFRDQLVETGHERRADDLDLIAGLGVRALRFPMLWERAATEDPEVYRWDWTDTAVARLSQLGLRPIAGLVHHGSGPRHTDLLADSFAPGLARYAEAVALRYPGIVEWTPVNEPLTTARFSALYGHWYPHRRDERSFWLALLNQVDGIRLAMKAIRKVQPAARLIQTDDLGRTYATVPLRDQAAFDNVRRWMGWDLLCGQVRPGHDLWKRLVGMGFEQRMHAIADEPCPPDIIGINHYLTSDRFLDHRIQRYPAHLRGGNGRRAYIDTEAVRVLSPPPAGLSGAIRESWGRYGIPIAVTEVHNGCTREEQMRWTVEAWRIAEAARAAGIHVEAVASWALLGSRGWDHLLTGGGRYEPGCFDVSSGAPRPTALCNVLRSLARDEKPAHPVLAGTGWWQREIRLHHPVAPRPARLRDHVPVPRMSTPGPAPLLITGATGTLGQAIAAACRHRAISHVLTRRSDLDIGDVSSIAEALDRHRPWAVINTAGWVRVDDAETEQRPCIAANADGAVRLATACAERGIPTVTFSSDLVFDGRQDRPYHEGDICGPLNVYGRSKMAAEHGIADLPGTHLIARTAAFFSPFDRHNFAVHAATCLRRGEPFRAAADHVVTPTYVPDLADAVLDLAIDGESGLWHLTSGTAMSWADFGRLIALACGLRPELIIPVPGAEMGWRAARPAFVPLTSRRGEMLPPLADAVKRFSERVASIQAEAEAAVPA